MTPKQETENAHTIAVLVDNEPGVLARVTGLFSGRGYNIESLTVAEVSNEENLSRITIVTSGTPMIIEQIKAQLSRLVPIHAVKDLTIEGPSVERELALVKVRRNGEGAGMEPDRLQAMTDNIDNTLAICLRARRALEMGRAVEKDLAEVMQAATFLDGEPGHGNGERMSYRDYVELSSLAEYAKFRDLPPLQAEDVATCNLELLAHRLSRSDAA